MSGQEGDRSSRLEDLTGRLAGQAISLDTYLIKAREAGLDRLTAARRARAVRSWPVPADAGPGAARRGGTLRVGLWLAPEGMDAAKATTRTSRLLTEHLYSTLTALDADGRPYPDLAEWIDVSDDACTYTFGIRRGVRFHDGSPVTADDVAFTLNRLLDPATHYHFEPWTATMAGAEVVPGEPDAVRLRLTQQTGPILTWLAFSGAGIVPRAAVEDGRDLMTDPIGSGPFRHDATAPAGTIRLVRAEGGDAQPWLDAIEFVTLPDDDARTRALLDGAIDLDPLMSPRGWDQVQASQHHRPLATGDGRWHWLMVNCADGLLADLGVRRAIAVGLDRVELASQGFGDHAHPLLGGVVAPWSWAFAPDLEAYQPRGDRRLARALLDAAAVPLGTPLRIAALQTLPIAQLQAHLVARQLREIGFDPSVRVLPAGEWSETVRRGGAFQLATSYWGSPINDPDDFVYMGFRSGARYDLGQCGSPTLDDLLERGRASIDQVERTELYRRLQTAMADELPLIPTIQPDVLRGVTRRLRDFVPLRNAQLRSLREAWLEAA